jgi:RNA polymerase sigma-70 factor (ECF subfamily)
MVDNEHIEALKSGNVKLFEEIYHHYFPSLYNYALNITKNRTHAEDAVSEVFLNLWENRENIQIETSLKAYLFKSVYHGCLNILKHIQIQEKYRDFFIHHTPDELSSSDYPLSDVIEHEINEILQKTIEKLPEQCRKIFVMSRLEGIKHEKIAHELGISINTVRTQIRRALEKLRIELKDYLTVIQTRLIKEPPTLSLLISIIYCQHLLCVIFSEPI